MRATAAARQLLAGELQSQIESEGSICTLGGRGSCGGLDGVRMPGGVLHCLATQGAHCRNAAACVRRAAQRPGVRALHCYRIRAYSRHALFAVRELFKAYLVFMFCGKGSIRQSMHHQPDFTVHIMQFCNQSIYREVRFAASNDRSGVHSCMLKPGCCIKHLRLP